MLMTIQRYSGRGTARLAATRAQRLMAVLVLLMGIGWTGFAENEFVRVTVYNLPKPGEPGIMFRAQRAVVDAFLSRPENAHVELAPFMGLRAQGLELEVGPLMAIAGGSPRISSMSISASRTATFKKGFCVRLTTT